MKNISKAVLLLTLMIFAGLANAEVDPELLERATQGHAIAQNNLGVAYSNGEGVPKDDKEAVKWYRLAAEQGVATAQNHLGVMYYNGEGVPKDDKEAVKWWRLAADQGVAKAQFNLGVRYELGEGVPKDDKEAVKWYRLAAGQGHVSAQHTLGFMYVNGLGVPKDDKEAVKWYRLAANQRYGSLALYAYRYLGPIHREGGKEAVRWHRLVANQGNAEAQYTLGLKYATGSGVPEDNVLAYMWWNIAGANGHRVAESVRGILTMSQADISKAQELTRQYIKDHPDVY